MTLLPDQFKPLEDILQEMPILKKDRSPGLLAIGKLGFTVDCGAFPDLSTEVEIIFDYQLLHGTCLFV